MTEIAIPLPYVLALIAWLIGAMAAFGVGFFTVWRLVMGKINDHALQVELQIKEHVQESGRRSTELHNRINDVREKYVRRDDLDQHVRHLSGQFDELSRQIAGVSDRLDKVIIRNTEVGR